MRPALTNEKKSLKALFKWPVFLVANLAILLLVGISTLRETYRGWTVDREIKAMEAQVEMLEGRKIKLIELTDTLMKPEQVELEARRRLGWKKDDEQVVVLTGLKPTSTLALESIYSAGQKEKVELSNPERWLNYFFKK